MCYLDVITWKNYQLTGIYWDAYPSNYSSIPSLSGKSRLHLWAFKGGWHKEASCRIFAGSNWTLKEQYHFPFGSLRIPSDPFGSLRIPSDPFGSLRIPSDPFGNQTWLAGKNPLNGISVARFDYQWILFLDSSSFMPGCPWIWSL